MARVELARIVTCDVTARKAPSDGDARGFVLYIGQFFPFVQKGRGMARSHMKRRKVNKKHRKNIRRLKALARKRRMEAKAAAVKGKRK